MTYFPPEPLTSQHLPTHFDCGKSQSNRWLIQHALANEMTGRSRTFVVREDSDMRTVGFYCLSTAIMAYGDATTRAAAGLPVDQPIPAVLLGRLAADLTSTPRPGQRSFGGACGERSKGSGATPVSG